MTSNQDTVRALWPAPLDFVEAAVLERDGLVESRHRAIAAVTDPEGKSIDHLGSAKRLIYPRSAVKPIQTVAMRRAGLPLEGAELAICCGSHQGRVEHRDLVAGILQKAGLDETALQCPEAWPGNPSARAEVAQASKLSFNCSGKHAGFLLASKLSSFSTEGYLEVDHPLQLMVREVLEEFAGEKILHTTIDGCGAPLHTITVEGLARAIGQFAATETEVSAAMQQNAWAVGDTESIDALVMKYGMVAKLGAEGVFVIGLESGHGVAVKIADGALRAAPLVALTLLHRNQLIVDDVYAELKNALAVYSLGGDKVIGELRVL